VAERSSERVLVTGASGFIGGHIAGELARRGYQVRAAYRRRQMPPRLAQLAEQGVEALRIDLTAPKSADDGVGAIPEALEGVDAVVHVAALAGDWGPLELYERQNYDATVELLDAARSAGCRKFVFTSSIAVHGFGPHDGTTEEGPYYPPIVPYQITKKMAEDFVLAENGKDIATTAIRPGNVTGPGDTSTMFPMFEAMQRGLRGTVNRGRSLTCPVFVGDVADAHIRALENPAADGLAFNITSGERVDWAEYTAYACKALGLPEPSLNIPLGPAFAIARFLEAVYHLFRIKNAPTLTLYRISQVAYDYSFSIERARRVLGFEPRVGWKEAVTLAAEDFLRRSQNGDTGKNR